MKKIYLLLLVILFSFLMTSDKIFAWNDCPLNLINDPAPGRCSLYVDTNADDICDRSQPLSKGDTPQSTTLNNYHFAPLCSILIFLYLTSYILSKRRVISVVRHRKIWNAVLLVSFLVCGISGIVCVLRLNLGLQIAYYSQIVFWHVESGIIMTIIGFFHFIWHWNYFKSYLRKQG